MRWSYFPIKTFPRRTRTKREGFGCSFLEFEAHSNSISKAAAARATYGFLRLHPDNPNMTSVIMAPTRSFGQREKRTSQRSEEHTSELQSLRHLVCRLLL